VDVKSIREHLKDAPRGSYAKKKPRRSGAVVMRSASFLVAPPSGLPSALRFALRALAASDFAGDLTEPPMRPRAAAWLTSMGGMLRCHCANSGFSASLIFSILVVCQIKFIIFLQLR